LHWVNEFRGTRAASDLFVAIFELFLKIRSSSARWRETEISSEWDVEKMARAERFPTPGIESAGSFP